MPPPTRIAILGGGLTGLSATLHAARRFPNARIVLFERSSRLGGWVRSHRVEVEAPVVSEGSSTSSKITKASILLETGPRTLRPSFKDSGKAVFELIHLLNLQNSLVTVENRAPAAKNRFIYISDRRRGLELVPSGPLDWFSSPYLASTLLLAFLRDIFKDGNRREDKNGDSLANEEWDESVDSLLTRRFGVDTARALGSALVHGVYASDSRELSVRSAFPSFLEAEERGEGSVVHGLVLKILQGLYSNTSTPNKGSTFQLGNVPWRMKDVSVFSFMDGLQTLPRTFESALRRFFPNVTIRLGVDGEVKQVRPMRADIEVHPSKGSPLLFSHVISALPLPVLHTLTKDIRPLPHLTANKSASITLVHLIFPPSPTEIHPAGFGYLVSRPEHGYQQQDPVTGEESSGFLGCVFDSSSLGAQDKIIGGDGTTTDGVGFTKMTVMLGGPNPLSPSQTSIPNILRHLSSHLGHALPPPVYSAVYRNENCIPTYGVGHLTRMKELKEVLDGPGWEGRLKVVGAGVGGASVGDCINAGREAALKL